MIWLLAGVPVDVGRDEARDAAARELSDPAYQAAEPSLFVRILRWAGDRLAELFTGIGVLGTGGIAGLMVLALLVVLIAMIVRRRVGRVARSRRRSVTVFDGRPLPAADHRAAAENALAQGDLAVAIRERFRAIVRELEDRGVLTSVSGYTVDEIAAAAGVALPSLAASLGAAARIFDDVVYGDRPATVDGYRVLSSLDDQVRAARLVGSSS